MRAALLIAIVGIACSNPASAAEFPENGFRFRCDARVNINGWRCYGGGFYSNNGKEECCIDTFSPFKAGVASGRTRWNPDRIILVRTKAITRTSTGGIDFEEIVESILVKRKNTEEFIQASSTCRMNDQDAFLLSVLDRRKKTIIGISWDGIFKQTFFNWRVYPCADDF